MFSPIQRIEQLEKFLPMLEEMFLEFEAHRQAHDLTKVGVSELNPVQIPATSGQMSVGGQVALGAYAQHESTSIDAQTAAMLESASRSNGAD